MNAWSGVSLSIGISSSRKSQDSHNGASLPDPAWKPPGKVFSVIDVCTIPDRRKCYFEDGDHDSIGHLVIDGSWTPIFCESVRWRGATWTTYSSLHSTMISNFGIGVKLRIKAFCVGNEVPRLHCFFRGYHSSSKIQAIEDFPRPETACLNFVSS